ncbi:integrase core domain-containing protein [Burkholderia cepacia]|uniref:integrase core domain-containing protein n=1 Tax=Burkholderia cepacia TaxID=292 RepID=UPI0009BCFC81
MGHSDFLIDKEPHQKTACVEPACVCQSRRRTQAIEAWRTDYNSLRPHSALGNVAPDQFRQLHQPGTGESTKLRMVYSAR